MAIDVKKLLSEALLELCERKALDKVTVTDVIVCSHVARQTFYNYFCDKYALINWTWNYYIMGDGVLDENGSLYGYILKGNLNCLKYRKFFQQAIQIISPNNVTMMRGAFGDGIFTPEVKFALDFNAFAAASMHIKWIQDGMQLSPEKFTRLLVDNIPVILRPYLPID